MSNSSDTFMEREDLKLKDKQKLIHFNSLNQDDRKSLLTYANENTYSTTSRQYNLLTVNLQKFSIMNL